MSKKITTFVNNGTIIRILIPQDSIIMKTTQKLILALVAVAAFLFVGTGAANAQQKFGYINSQELIVSMPETDSVQSKVSTLAKDLENQYNAMQTEMITKTQELQSNLNTLSETVRKQKEKCRLPKQKWVLTERSLKIGGRKPPMPICCLSNA